MLVMAKDKKSVFNITREDFIKAEITKLDGAWCIFCYRKNHDENSERLRIKNWLGNYRTRERAEEQLNNLMTAMCEDKYWIIEDETREEK